MSSPLPLPQNLRHPAGLALALVLFLGSCSRPAPPLPFDAPPADARVSPSGLAWVPIDEPEDGESIGSGWGWFRATEWDSTGHLLFSTDSLGVLRLVGPTSELLPVYREAYEMLREGERRRFWFSDSLLAGSIPGSRVLEAELVERFETPPPPPGVDLAERGPDRFRVAFETSKGRFVIEAVREWSPLGVDRLHQLARSGLWNGASLFRVVPGFVVQFGLSNDFLLNQLWEANPVDDEPVLQSNVRGAVAYARAGARTRSAQIYINLADNARLDTIPGAGVVGFPPIGRVVEGMDVVDSLFSGHGNAPAMEQDAISVYGRAYLDEKYPGLDWIERVTLVEEDR